MNFTNIVCISNNEELRGIVSSPGCTLSVIELGALSKATALAASRCQLSLPSVLADWFGDPLSVRISSESFMEWINMDSLKYIYMWNLH